MTALEERLLEEAVCTTLPLFTVRSFARVRAYKLYVGYAVQSWDEALMCLTLARTGNPPRNTKEIFLCLRRAFFQSSLIVDPSFRSPGIILVVPRTGALAEDVDREVERLLLQLIEQ